MVGDRDDSDSLTAHLRIDRIEIGIEGTVIGGDNRCSSATSDTQRPGHCVIVDDVGVGKRRVRTQRVWNLHDRASHSLWRARGEAGDLRHWAGAACGSGEQHLMSRSHQSARKLVDDPLNTAVPHWRNRQPGWRNQPDQQAQLLSKVELNRGPYPTTTWTKQAGTIHTR